MVFMMVGGSAAHTIIKGRCLRSAQQSPPGGSCRALTEGLKVVTPDNVHYPDVAVICTPIQPTDDAPLPAVQVELDLDQIYEDSGC